jgi:flagellar biosynthesis protein FlhA
MDGASKFVRGDAIAGLMIVAINVVGGIIIAVAQKGMSFSDATQTFTLLTVGDGLVSQMPALIVSTAAGLMVSKAGVEGSTDKALMNQLSFYPQALGMASAVMGIVAVLPGHADISCSRAFPPASARSPGSPTRKRKTRVVALQKQEAKSQADSAPKEEPISTALALDLLRVELGYGLLPLINDVKGHRITDQIKALRRQLAQEMGFVMPSVRILDNMQLGANEYCIRVKEVESGRGELFPGSLLVMDPKGAPIDCRARTRPSPPSACPRPGSRRPARGSVVPRLHRGRSGHGADDASDRSAEEPYVGASVLCGDKKLLDDLPAEHKKLVEELIPSQISVTGVQRVLQTLLAERVSIRDLPAILEGIAEAVGHTKNALYITEHVRARLRARSATSTWRPAAICRSSRCRPPGNRLSRNPSWDRAKTASSRWRRRSSSNSSRACATASTKPRRRATCPCCSRARRCVPSCAPSSSASAPRPW